MEVHNNIAYTWAPYICATEAPEANFLNQEHHQDDSAQDFDPDDDAIVENTVYDSDGHALSRERNNCTLWIENPVKWTHFLTDTSYNANTEDTKK